MLFRKRQRIKMLVSCLGLTLFLLGCTSDSVTPSAETVDTLTSQPELEPTQVVGKLESSQTRTNTSMPATATFLPTVTQTPSPTETPIPSKTPRELPILMVDEFGVPMALIPAGAFQMGDAQGQDYEKPVHDVILDAFYIDQYEVTNSRYAKCVAVGRCNPPATSTDPYIGEVYYTEAMGSPVIYVNWDNAQNYCQWRGARLPTEAEWEKAARGGLAGMRYPWGNDAPVCDFGAENGAQSDACGGKTVPVGSFGANGYGLYDMAGNVWEWVADWYDSEYYANSPENNPPGPEESSDYRVMRGGAWGFNNEYLRVAHRNAQTPSGTYAYYNNVGFRCARFP